MYTPKRESSLVDLTESPELPLPEPVSVESQTLATSSGPTTAESQTTRAVDSDDDWEPILSQDSPSSFGQPRPSASQISTVVVDPLSSQFRKLSVSPSSPYSKGLSRPSLVGETHQAQPNVTSTSLPTSKASKGTPLAKYICPICFSPPKDAVLTPCGHIMCGECLFSAVRAARVRNMESGQDASKTLCPVCRELLKGWDWRREGVIPQEVKGYKSSRSPRGQSLTGRHLTYYVYLSNLVPVR